MLFIYSGINGNEGVFLAVDGSESKRVVDIKVDSDDPCLNSGSEVPGMSVPEIAVES